MCVRGPLVGWRAWRVVALGGEVRLRSAVFEQTWEPERRAVAACASGHRAPDPACVCGVYAVGAPADAVRYLVGRDDPDVLHRVLGQVELRGVTVECERGWRSRAAYPTRLLVPAGRTSGARVDARAIAAALAGAYAVPAEVVAAAEPPALLRELAA
jgi:hypothetical protein